MPSSLLTTKFQRPVLRMAVPRPRLITKLASATDYPLVLVSAPVGFGKTTLIAQWLLTLSGVQVAWLSLDENDNSLSRFLSYLISALQQVEPHLGRGLPDLLLTPQPPDAETILTALINDLAALEEMRLVLVLDDYHLLDLPEIDQAMNFLLGHLPPNLCCVLLTRIDPALPLARMRVRGQLLEIREQDLRFTLDESRLFLDQQIGSALSGNDLALLHGHTEGWAAGLQLAGLALRDQDQHFIQAFTGTHRYILDYLTDEVFVRQSVQVQHFLLETSILNRMCGDLCNAVRGATDSQQVLEFLERANLFLVPLDAQRGWFRYHHLFAALLRQRLRQSGIAAEALHQRASRWYAQAAAQDPAAVDDALGHAWAAQDHAETAALLNRFVDDLWERGEQDTLRLWIGRLPEAVRNGYPALNITLAWLRFTEGSYAESEQAAARAGQALPADALELHGRLAAVRAFVATFQGNTDMTLRFAQQAMQQLEPTSTWRASAAIALGDAYSLRGDPAAADAYAEAYQSSRAAGNAYLALNAGFKRGVALRQRGLLREAHTLCEALLVLAETTGLVQSPITGSIYALQSEILCEWDRLDEALGCASQALALSQPAQHIGFSGWIVLYSVRTLLSARQFERADQALRSLETHTALLPPWIASPLMGLRVLWWLASGDMPRALAWASTFSAEEAIENGREFEALIQARLMAMQGQIDAALRLLERLQTLTQNMNRDSLTLIVLLTRTRLCQLQGDTESATAALTAALAIGQRGEFLRSFLDAGSPILPLLHAAEARGITPDYTRRLIKHLSLPAGLHKLDALSERELEVLRLIASGLKNQQIADTLVVSLNTVLYHTKNIYSKLNVTHRTQAVQRARDLNLL